MENNSAEILVSKLLDNEDISQEQECLQNLLDYLKGKKDGEAILPASSTEDLESSFLRRAKLSESDNSVFPNELLSNKAVLNDLTFYLFQRRFGWSEQSIDENNDLDFPSPQHNLKAEETEECSKEKFSPGKKRRSGSLQYIHESKVKTKLNRVLDELIQLYGSEEELCHEILESYLYTLQQANNLPVVRSQLLCHIFGWLAAVVSETVQINPDVFPLIKMLIVSGITDIWSAIRNNCATKMMSFVECFSIPNLIDIFEALLALCEDGDDSQWQAKEGAVMALTKILRSFKLAAISSSIEVGKVSSDVSSDALTHKRFGSHMFASLPTFIVEPLNRILYKLLSDPQLSIREHANRLFSAFLLRSEFTQVFNCFKEVLLHLAKDAVDGSPFDSGKSKFVDASRVDGFLKAAEFLIKQIPTKYILNNWDLCFATFSHYLMHPASTVRQAASSVFKYLVAKQTLTLQLPTLVVKNLLSGWKTDIASLKSSNLDQKNRLSASSQRSGVKILESNYTEDVDVTELWEWREGRLLAYELILKFFITNHIHYTFPAYTISRAAEAAGAAAFQRSFQRPNLANFQKFSMSHNIGAREELLTRKHEKLSRSLTMESDPFTQRFISSLVEKEKTAVNQTSSLLEALRQKETCIPSFEDLKEVIGSDNISSSLITKKMIEDFQTESPSNHYRTSTNECWSSEQEQTSFGEILIQIFIQTIECLADSRWELRRMAHQVLPLISETMRFYDARLLENLWASYLSSNSSKLGFGACVSLKDSLSHAARLVKYFENPPEFWKDIDRCRLAAKRIVNSINESLPQLLCQIDVIVQRPYFDRLTVIAIEVLMLSVIHFPQESIERTLISNVILKLELLFIHAFPDNDYASYLIGKIGGEIGKFETPKRGLLSCSTKGNSFGCTARQVQNHYYIEFQRLMPLFIRQSSLHDTVYLLPIMLNEIKSLIEASVDVQSHFQTCNSIVKDAASAMKSVKCGSLTESEKKIEEVLGLACSELCNIITSKTLELHFLRQYLDVLVSIYRISRSRLDLKRIFAAVSETVDVEDCLFVNDVSAESHESSEGELLRIRLLSNDIRQSPIDQVNITNEEELEDSSRNLLESQALSRNLDLNGNFEEYEEERAASPHQRVESPLCEDSSSDWDSWDDEDEDICQTREALGSFLNKLCEATPRSNKKDSIFKSELSLCNSKDRRLLEGLLASVAEHE